MLIHSLGKEDYGCHLHEVNRMAWVNETLTVSLTLDNTNQAGQLIARLAREGTHWLPGQGRHSAVSQH